MNAALRSIKAKALFICSPQDQFYLPHHIETQVKAIPTRARCGSIRSPVTSSAATPIRTLPAAWVMQSERFWVSSSAKGEIQLRSESDMRAARSFDRNRRTFLARTGAMGATALLGRHGNAAAAEPPPEIRKLRLLHVPAICHAPQYLAEDLLHLEGITEVEYVPFGTRYIPAALAESKADMSMWNAMEFIPYMDANKPVVALAGIHSGCFEVFASGRVQSVRDLKGKTVAIMYPGGGDHILLSSMLAYVGIDPREVNWMPGTTSLLDAMDAFSRRQG